MRADAAAAALRAVRAAPVARIGQVALQRAAVGGHGQRAAALDVVGRVADVQPPLLLPEHVGREHDEAVQRVLLGHLRMCSLTPKISCNSSSPGPLPAGGSAR